MSIPTDWCTNSLVQNNMPHFQDLGGGGHDKKVQPILWGMIWKLQYTLPVIYEYS